MEESKRVFLYHVKCYKGLLVMCMLLISRKKAILYNCHPRSGNKLRLNFHFLKFQVIRYVSSHCSGYLPGKLFKSTNLLNSVPDELFHHCVLSSNYLPKIKSFCWYRCSCKRKKFFVPICVNWNVEIWFPLTPQTNLT